MKIIILGACLLLCNAINAQNLVPNPSFEYLTDCPVSAGTLDIAYPWFGAMRRNQLGASAEVYNICYTDTVRDIGFNPYKNVAGNQAPHQGDGFVGITFGSNISMQGQPSKRYREYIEIGLLDSLKKNQLYTLSFWICSAEISKCGMSTFQAYFTEDSLFTNSDIWVITDSILETSLAQFNYTNNIIYDTLKWTNIKCNFVAKGGEQFMTIGNFQKQDTMILHKFCNSSTTNPECFAYYYIDDVELYPATAPCYYPREAGTAIPYTPKPPPPPVPPPVLAPIVPTWVAASAGAAGAAQGRLVVQHLPPRSSLWLYNALGQLVYQSANYTNDYSFLQQNAAMYFYILRTPTTTLKGKILVTQ
jgi:hypothetical protein